MITINKTKEGWELYDSATEKDVATLNRAANKAVLDTLVEMQTEGIDLRAAMNIALAKAHDVFYRHAHIGAYDGEPLEILCQTVKRQFSLS